MGPSLSNLFFRFHKPSLSAANSIQKCFPASFFLPRLLYPVRLHIISPLFSTPPIYMFTICLFPAPPPVGCHASSAWVACISPPTVGWHASSAWVACIFPPPVGCYAYSAWVACIFPPPVGWHASSAWVACIYRLSLMTKPISWSRF